VADVDDLQVCTDLAMAEYVRSDHKPTHAKRFGTATGMRIIGQQPLRPAEGIA
jgi:hypothetical protein